ncbi:hypothetical protein EGM70_22040 [Enterobacteriaceae bacterium 89]|nr:hypothetical protein [Enterobacteriaceae bacterium 89]
MATIPTRTYPEEYQAQIEEVLAIPLSGKADLFTVADLCATFVSVMVECEEEFYRLALCGRLSHALTLLEKCCAEDLPDYLVQQLTVETLPVSAVPDCWHDTEMLVNYAKSLVQAVSGATLNEEVNRELTGLLHDLVYLLVEQVKTPFIERK